MHDGPVLGSGISGIVRLVKHRATQVSYAVKCLDLALIDSEEGLKQLKEEIYIMCQLVSLRFVRSARSFHSSRVCGKDMLMWLCFSRHMHSVQDHPNIVRLEEVYESHSEIYLVQEVCKGGELFDRLDEQPDYHYTEAQVSGGLSGIRFCESASERDASTSFLHLTCNIAVRPARETDA